MSVTPADLERRVLGDPLANDTRLVAGLCAVVGALGHAALALAALLFAVGVAGLL